MLYHNIFKYMDMSMVIFMQTKIIHEYSYYKHDDNFKILQQIYK